MFFTERDQIKIQKSKFWEFNLKYDVIHDVLKVIFNENLKRLRNYGDIGFSRDMNTFKNLAKNREIA